MSITLETAAQIGYTDKQKREALILSEDVLSVNGETMHKKFEDVIAEQGSLVYTNVGDSMVPVIREGNLLIIEAVKNPLKVGDVPLYKRDTGQYVLHRVVGIKNGKYIMKGDNRDFVERGITDRYIIGVLTGIVRNGKTYPVETVQEFTARVAGDLAYLVSCAVNEQTPDKERVNSMDLAEVYRLSKMHQLTAAAAFGLEKLLMLPPTFDEEKKRAVANLTLFEAERAAVTRELETAGIWYLPLKGIVLKNLYPKSAMREMSDNDILVDSAKMEDVKQIMHSLGFSGGDYDKDHDVVFKKPPSVVFEMHNRLFGKEHHPLYFAYYKNIRQKLLPVQGTNCGFQMTNEDFYIYLICHMHKHYHYAGTGLRSLLDVYVFQKVHGETLDKDYLAAELKKLKLTGFEADMRRLAEKVFSDSPLSEQEKETFAFLATSGTYGTGNRAMQYSIEKYIRDNNGKASKAKYILHRVFIPEKDVEKHYPFFYRHKLLYPVLPVYRLGTGLARHPKQITQEYKAFKRVKKEIKRNDKV